MVGRARPGVAFSRGKVSRRVTHALTIRPRTQSTQRAIVLPRLPVRSTGLPSTVSQGAALRLCRRKAYNTANARLSAQAPTRLLCRICRSTWLKVAREETNSPPCGSSYASPDAVLNLIDKRAEVHAALVPGGSAMALSAAGQYIEGFESGDFSALPWTTSGSAYWSVTDSNPITDSYSALALADALVWAGAGSLELTAYAESISFDVDAVCRTLGSEASLDFSVDGGMHWLSADTASYWAVGFSGPERGWAVGPGGRVTRIVLRP